MTRSAQAAKALEKTVHPVVLQTAEQGDVKMHILSKHSLCPEDLSTHLGTLCKVAVAAADAVLVYIDNLEEQLPVLSTLFQVGITPRFATLCFV